MKKESQKNENNILLYQLAAQARDMRDEEAKKQKNDIEAALIMLNPLNFYIKKIHNLFGQELKTFSKWQEAGFQVKKGSKGFIFFSSPKSFKEKKEEGASKEANDSRATYSRFCKCFLFSKDQVEAII